jgi:hypothetical protein
MRLPHTRLTLPARLRLPRRTARLRLTALYGGMFLVCGATLLTITSSSEADRIADSLS